jgi:hypothetical protein
MHFGTLDFVIITEEDLEQAPAPISPLPAMGLDTIIETLEGLRLHPSESRTMEHG